MKTNIETEVSNELLLTAIRMKESKNYNKAAKANKAGGKQTLSWWLCHNYTIKELLREAFRRKLNV